MDALPAFEARRELEVGSEPALLPRDWEVEKVRASFSKGRVGLRRETHLLAAGPRLCASLWRRTDEGLCSFYLDRVLGSVRGEKTSLKDIVGGRRSVIYMRSEDASGSALCRG